MTMTVKGAVQGAVDRIQEVFRKVVKGAKGGKDATAKAAPAPKAKAKAAATPHAKAATAPQGKRKSAKRRKAARR